MIKNIEKKLEKVKNEEMYSPEDITDFGVVLNTKLEPSRFTVYRLIKRRQLPSVNLGTEKSPKYFVKGSDLKKFVKERYKTY